MRTWMLVACLLLTACATPSAPVDRPGFLLHDALFREPSERISASDIFALSEPMRSFLKTEIASEIRRNGYQAGLAAALRKPGKLKLEYDAAMTRNAAQAFEARAGNCLSLVLMTAAFAKELGLPVRYQSAYLEETWNRSGDLLVRSGHINITLGGRLFDAGTTRWLNPLTIDFLPAAEIRGLRVREIDESTVVAMYMNNRAVEALAQGRIDDAYGWAREAIRQDPRLALAYNTLGVVYLRHGDLAAAERAFDYVLAREPKYTQALANLADALARQGRTAEADALRHRLAQLEPDPPFHFFNLGQAAMERGDYRAARDLFAREVARADYNPEFHFWLALANYRLGDLEAARRQLTQALDNSTSRRDRDLYAAKLAWLRGYGVQ
jgi:tetratricopeptide (TPR) repeat protein